MFEGDVFLDGQRHKVLWVVGAFQVFADLRVQWHRTEWGEIKGRVLGR